MTGADTEHFQPCLPIAYLHSSLLIRRLSSQHLPGRGNTDLHMVGQFLGFLAPSTSSSMTSSDQAPAATDEQSFRVVSEVHHQRRDFPCAIDMFVFLA